MASRPVILASLLGASVGVPYIASQAMQGRATPAAPATPAAVSTFPQGTTTPTTPIFAGPPISTAQPTASYPVAPAQIRMLPPVTSPSATPYPTAATPATPDGTQFTSAAQVLRFDITKEWVCRNWPRKSTGPTDVGLFAIRVPLVMGTQMSALAGALTYYFNAQDQVEHISFRGHTGDTTPLVQFLTQSYQFQPVASPTGEKVYQVASGDAVQSELRLRPEAVLNSSVPQQSIAVELEFARPGSKRVLPPHGPTLPLPPSDSPAAAATASQAPANTPANAASTTPAAATGSYWERVRHATPAEESQLLWKRWPQ